MTNNGSTPHYAYLIVGGGMAAHAAITGLRAVDPDGTIGLISFDRHPPYRRPPLSKGLWKGDPLDSIWYPSDMPGVDLHLGRRVMKIDPAARRVTGGRGDTYTFERLLLATGCSPRQLPLAAENILYFRTVNDFQRLRALAEAGQRFLLIGAGYIASELAAALKLNGKDTILAFRGRTLLGRILPRQVGERLSAYYAEQGVKLVPGVVLQEVERRGDVLRVVLQPSQGGALVEEEVDGIVAGVGTAPNVRLAREAMLRLAPEPMSGILVDEYLRTSHPDIYAAGDVANFASEVLGQRLIVDHEDNAVVMGECAGRNMAQERLGNSPEPYRHVPCFYSELFDLRFEAVGLTDPRLKTITHGRAPQEPAVTYYLADGRVRGVMLWNLRGQLQAARELLAEPGPFDAETLFGRLPAEADAALVEPQQGAGNGLA
jgi:NADPH-dependent 2,4-dienoyl-CoA reductase/sulfur reductase-like enzyme